MYRSKRQGAGGDEISWFATFSQTGYVNPNKMLSKVACKTQKSFAFSNITEKNERRKETQTLN